MAKKSGTEPRLGRKAKKAEVQRVPKAQIDFSPFNNALTAGKFDTALNWIDQQAGDEIKEALKIEVAQTMGATAENEKELRKAIDFIAEISGGMEQRMGQVLLSSVISKLIEAEKFDLAEIALEQVTTPHAKKVLGDLLARKRRLSRSRKPN